MTHFTQTRTRSILFLVLMYQLSSVSFASTTASISGYEPRIGGYSSPSFTVQTDPLLQIATGGGEGGGGEGGGDRNQTIKQNVGVTNRTTARITQGIDAVVAECQSIASQYRVSCIGDGLVKVAAKAPPGPDYRAVKKQLNRTGRKLQKIAQTNRDKTARQSNRGYTPVQRNNLAAANQAATKVIREAQTTLLRSAENSRTRRVHYQKIARSLGNTRRLLRS